MQLIMQIILAEGCKHSSFELIGGGIRSIHRPVGMMVNAGSRSLGRVIIELPNNGFMKYVTAWNKVYALDKSIVI